MRNIMKIIRPILLLPLFLLLTIVAKAQDKPTDDYFDTAFVFNSNKIYKTFVKTPEIRNASSENALPIITLNGNDKILLSFDDIQADLKDYQYTVIACDYKWDVSDLKPYEYLDGFQTDLIENFESSLATDYPYTHFEVLFPGDYLKLTKAGNYIVKVFVDEESDENTVLTWRFMVKDPKLSVTGMVKKALTGEEQQGYNQRLEITLNTRGNYFINASQNIKVVVTQNNRWDNAKYGIKPTSIVGDKIEYFNDENLIFRSGNEYRHFDFKDFRYHEEDIRSIESTPMGNFVSLSPDKRRTFKKYYSEKDINGRRLIRTELDRNTDYEADYAEVDFSLPYNYPIGLGDFYILGQLTNWEICPEGKMNYNFQDNKYEATLFLKQGYYDYIYAFVESGKSEGDVTLIEGNYLETENEYMIYVYYREPGTFYDQLIGSGIVKNTQ
jgi:type 9 secretion system plug protein